MKKLPSVTVLICVLFSMMVIAPNVRGFVNPTNSTVTTPISIPSMGGSTNITSSASAQTDTSFSPCDPGCGSFSFPSGKKPVSTPLLSEKSGNGSTGIGKESAVLSNYHWWSIDYWCTSGGLLLPSKMNGSFVAVDNTIDGLQSGDSILYLPLNVAYGASIDNYIWCQFCIYFNPNHDVQWSIWDIPDGDANRGVSHTIAAGLYVTGHTYNFELKPSIYPTKITFTLTDTAYPNPIYKCDNWSIPVPGIRLLYEESAFAPASAIEGYTTSLQITHVPFFQTYVGYGETTHYHTDVGSGEPMSIYTGVWTAASNYYYWAMLGTDNYISSIVAHYPYGNGGTQYETNLIGWYDGAYALIWGGNVGDGGTIVGQMSELGGGNVYVLAYSTTGYLSDLYVYVSMDNQHWNQVGSKITVSSSTPYLYPVGTVHFGFKYMAVAGYDSVNSVYLHLDCVKAGL